LLDLRHQGGHPGVGVGETGNAPAGCLGGIDELRLQRTVRRLHPIDFAPGGLVLAGVSCWISPGNPAPTVLIGETETLTLVG
jgi:hypothetical protein